MKTRDKYFGYSFEHEVIQLENKLNTLKSSNGDKLSQNDINYNSNNNNEQSAFIMNGLSKYKSQSNHELGAKTKLPGHHRGTRSISRYDSDTITTRESRSDRITIYGQPLNVNTKAFVEAANRKARMVTFFKNGEAFSRAIRVSIIPGKTFKSFHNLCDYLTAKSMIPLGVRYVINITTLLINHLFLGLSNDSNNLTINFPTFQIYF